MAKKLTSNKAKEIMHDKSVHGHPLTDKQRRFFGAIAGGATPMKDGGWLDSYPEAQNGIDAYFEGYVPSTKITRPLVEGIKNNMLGYIQSPLYKKRLGYYPESGGLDEYNNSINSIKQRQRASNLQNANISISPIGNSNDRYISKLHKVDLNNMGDTAGIAHELGHSTFGGDTSFSGSDLNNYEAFSSGLNPSNYSSFLNYNEIETLNKHSNPNFFKLNMSNPHFDSTMLGSSANESYGDLMGVRQLLYENGITKKFGDDINKESLKKALKNKNISENPDFKRMRSKYDLDKIIMLNNTIAQNNNDGVNDAPIAQNGIEGTMGGLTDVGFDYNGAWGGTMAMGGSIPGAVGFTYARTNSPAPSNGPYAKKTKASAQNGQEMKYYQEGLDWKPKTISKNGGWLDKFQEGGEKTYGTYQLPEVVITGQAPEKGFWDQSIDAYLKDNKDVGLLGALGSVITYPLGLPQQAMMYGLTGKVQKPSEALGVKNSLGAIVTDVILDPTNLVGAGVLDDTYKLTSKAGKFLTEETALKNAYKYNPFAFKPNPEAYYRGVGEEGFDDILQSGIIRSKKQHAYPEPYFSKGMVGDKYAKGYFIELEGEPMKGVGSFSTGDLIQTPINQIGLNNPNLKLYKKDWLRGYKQVPKRQDGGIIEDPMGQWAHPGEITRIPSNEITMQGVDYPVLGISDTGDTQMMQPGKDYTFYGSSVTEIPMMKNGGSTATKIICPSCGWSWNRSEGGNDPYVCHKCGMNNASKLQKGGEVDPGYSEPDYVTGTSRRTFNKFVGMGNYLVPAKTLNRAADIAEAKGYGYGEDSSGPLDAIRHASASSSIASKLPIPEVLSKYYPNVDKALRIAGANILGGAYELANFNPEGLLMDIKNNYKGSLIGSIPGLSDEQRNQLIVKQLQNKNLTVDNPNKKKKENGGWLNKYE